MIAGGRTYWAPQGAETVRAQVEALPEGVRRRVVLTGYVSDEEKRALLAGATVLAYPSRYEGFGFPVLEGFSAGVPVLTSSAASLPEVAGDAALLVDPNDVDAIGEGLGPALRDPDLRERLVAAGRERLATFSWGRAAGVDRRGAPRAPPAVRPVLDRLRASMWTPLHRRALSWVAARPGSGADRRRVQRERGRAAGDDLARPRPRARA